MDGGIAAVVSDGAGQLRAAVAKLTDYSALLPKLGALGVHAEQRHIEESHAPDGAPYPPLKHDRPEGHAHGNHPLLDTTRMYQSIHFKVDAIDSVFSGPSLADAPYFPNQNQGAPARHIPPRVFIGLGAEDITDAADVVLHHALKALA
jgi:hypothetical protein